MRACFLGQSVCTLGFGVAVIQTPPAEDKPAPEGPAETPLLDMPADALPLPNRMFAELKRQPHYV
jgi:hypothetical protein